MLKLLSTVPGARIKELVFSDDPTCGTDGCPYYGGIHKCDGTHVELPLSVRETTDWPRANGHVLVDGMDTYWLCASCLDRLKRGDPDPLFF